MLDKTKKIKIFTYVAKKEVLGPCIDWQKTIIFKVP